MPYNVLRLWFRLQWWALRRHWLCPRGDHVWRTFGRSRVCRCCHREEWHSEDGWHSAKRGFAESMPSWHTTEPQDCPTNGVDPV